MRNITINFPDKEEINLLIKNALIDLLPDIAKRSEQQGPPAVQYLTRSEVISKYKISMVTLHTHTVNGLPSIKVGRRRLYDSSVVENYFHKKKLK